MAANRIFAKENVKEHAPTGWLECYTTGTTTPWKNNCGVGWSGPHIIRVEATSTNWGLATLKSPWSQCNDKLITIQSSKKGKRRRKLQSTLYFLFNQINTRLFLWAFYSFECFYGLFYSFECLCGLFIWVFSVGPICQGCENCMNGFTI